MVAESLGVNALLSQVVTGELMAGVSHSRRGEPLTSPFRPVALRRLAAQESLQFGREFIPAGQLLAKGRPLGLVGRLLETFDHG